VKPEREYREKRPGGVTKQMLMGDVIFMCSNSIDIGRGFLQTVQARVRRIRECCRHHVRQVVSSGKERDGV